MLKQQVVKNVQSVTGSTLKDANAAVEAVFETIAQALEGGEDVLFTGFGRFTVRKRRARKGVNPQKPTERIDLPETYLPSFKAGKTLKDRVSKAAKSKSK